MTFWLVVLWLIPVLGGWRLRAGKGRHRSTQEDQEVKKEIEVAVLLAAITLPTVREHGKRREDSEGMQGLEEEKVEVFSKEAEGEALLEELGEMVIMLEEKMRTGGGTRPVNGGFIPPESENNKGGTRGEENDGGEGREKKREGDNFGERNESP
jgi:hypothetical protein